MCISIGTEGTLCHSCYVRVSFLWQMHHAKKHKHDGLSTCESWELTAPMWAIYAVLGHWHRWSQSHKGRRSWRCWRRRLQSNAGFALVSLFISTFFFILFQQQGFKASIVPQRCVSFVATSILQSLRILPFLHLFSSLKVQKPINTPISWSSAMYASPQSKLDWERKSAQQWNQFAEYQKVFRVFCNSLCLGCGSMSQSASGCVFFSQFSIMFLIVVGDKNVRYPGIIPQQEEESGIPSPQSVTKKPNFNRAWCSKCILTQDLDAELDRKFHFPLGCQDFWIARGMNRGAPRRKCARPLVVGRMAPKARGVQNFSNC